MRPRRGVKGQLKRHLSSPVSSDNWGCILPSALKGGLVPLCIVMALPSGGKEGFISCNKAHQLAVAFWCSALWTLRLSRLCRRVLSWISDVCHGFGSREWQPHAIYLSSLPCSRNHAYYKMSPHTLLQKSVDVITCEAFCSAENFGGIWDGRGGWEQRAGETRIVLNNRGRKHWSCLVHLEGRTWG